MNALSIVLLLAAFAQVAAEQAAPPTPAAEQPATRDTYVPSKSASGDPIFGPATITAEQDIPISAEVEGTLRQLPIREGMRVTLGQLLAAIDDRTAKAAVEVADLTLQAAQQRASDNIEERYAKAAAQVAYVDWQRDKAANQQKAGSVADIQILQKKLVFDRSVLQTDKAQKDQLLAKKEAEVKGAELKASKILLDQRQISAPFDGEVQQMFQKEGQWVKPGDPVLRLVKFDTLRVECFVNASQYDPVDLANRRVTVTAHLARGREASVEGRVVYVDQTVLLNNYRVRAEVQNQREGDFWLLRPGLSAEMTIHTSEPPLEVEEPKTARQLSP